MEFNLYPAQSDEDTAFFLEEEYQSALENQILLKDRSAEEARLTFINDLNGYLDNLNHNKIYTAQTKNGEYAGMVWLAERTSKEPWDFSPYPAWIYDIRVRPEFRRLGLGRLLLQKADEWTAECGLAEIGLHVYGQQPDRDPALPIVRLPY